jgi:hypothetical protein
MGVRKRRRRLFAQNRADVRNVGAVGRSRGLVHEADNDDKQDYYRGKQPRSFPLLFIREQGDDDDHEDTDQCQHARISR